MSTPVQKNRPRLGRGLGSLISVDLPQEEPSTEIVSSPNPPRPADTSVWGQGMLVPVAQIAPNPHQPRRNFDEGSLRELADSIRSSGLIQPVIVRRSTSGFELVAGERRLRAAKLAGLESIPVILRNVDAIAQAQMALIENIQRQDLNPIERAQGYRNIMQQLGLTQAELASRLGEDRSSIANYLRLLDLAEPVRDMLRDGRLSLGHGKLLAGVSDILEQQRLADLTVSQGLSVRNLERLIQAGGSPPAPKAPAAVSPHIRDLEKSLSRQLGMRVQVRSSSRKGRGSLVIHYASLDQFDDLLSRLGLTADQ